MEDRRGQGGLGGGSVEAAFPIPVGKAGGGLGLIVLVALALLFGGNVLGGGGADSGLSPGLDETVPSASSGSEPGSTTPGGDDAFEFAKFVSKDTQDMWTQIFEQSGKQYARAPVVIFTSGTNTGGCGPASSATGPFYCPADEQGLPRPLASSGSCRGASARRATSPRRTSSRTRSATTSRASSGSRSEVRRKQQEDPAGRTCTPSSSSCRRTASPASGRARRTTAGCSTPGDIEEGLAAAAAVGDDRLGARSREQWTHGSSELRTQWFRTGFDSGKPGDCDTSGVDL